MIMMNSEQVVFSPRKALLHLHHSLISKE